jgi:DNA gyrase subunit A
MRLGLGQQVISLITAADETLSVLTATQNGYGKRTQIDEYTRHGRGTQGMIAIQCSERNGKLVAAELVAGDDEIVLITTGGVLIRMRVSEIREAGRSTQGVRLINLGDNEALAGIEKIVEPEEAANGEAANGDVNPGTATGEPPDNGGTL